ncbi:LLM class flavin-dependent oxidoreductase [Marinibacterium profundimaris]|uniref:Nitrilotriacetate monooxygenase n=1 Tax=Marinibacterium profundimaris TaxID=1679460 RepID=A0A225NLE6_9RHOB|nr:LLM class flavin-dependent oxidoreductase [Marinibacterium profundimaris]OWU75008.1 nitrilotriacetate monooxygenase [Marinibacterium profundimaris]
MTQKQLKLGAFFSSGHPAGWRLPEAFPETDMSFPNYMHMAQTAERGKLDCIFFQDTVGVVGGVKENATPTKCRIVWPEPATLIAALAAVTKNIGLVSTATTTYSEPYTIARRFGSVDCISNGRAGWNVVTSQVELEAMNFGQDSHMEHGARYEKAEEFVDICFGLWDSFEDGAFLRNKETGIFYDPSLAHELNHEGKYFKVKGPLNLPRTPQGRPVIAQAGSSEVGIRFAARCADMIFTAQSTIPEGQAFYKKVKEQVASFGRNPDHVKIMPGLMPILGATREEAQETYDKLVSMTLDEVSIRSLNHYSGGLDLTQLDPDIPLPDLPPANTAKARQDLIVAKARAENLTIRQTAQYVAVAQGHHTVVGSASDVADLMQAWLEAGACDGFMLMSPFYPVPLERIVDHLVPELQRRGIFRTEYEGTTLRDSLGIPVPENRYTAMAKAKAS